MEAGHVRGRKSYKEQSAEEGKDASEESDEEEKCSTKQEKRKSNAGRLTKSEWHPRGNGQSGKHIQGRRQSESGIHTNRVRGGDKEADEEFSLAS